jgi:hypothetical protein
VVLLVLTVGVVTASSPATAAEKPAAEIVLAGISPTVVTPTDEVQVTGTIRNVGDQPISYLTARLHVLRDRLGTRDELDDWMGGDRGEGPVAGRTIDLFPSDDPTLAPGDSVPFTLTLNQVELGLTGFAFGSFGLAVEARGQLDGPRTEVGLLRTAVVWAPAGLQGEQPYMPQQLAVLVPFTGVPNGDGPEPMTLQQVAASVAPGSRLRHLLEAASAPGVGWAIDPALLRTLTDAVGSRPSVETSPPTTSPTTATSTGSLTPTGDSTSPAPGSTGSPTTTPLAGTATTSSSPTSTDPDDVARARISDFLSDMRMAAHGRTVVELPYADPDVQAVTDAGEPRLLHAANATGAGTVQEVLGVPAATDVAWPAEGWADDDALAALSGDGTTTVVLDSRARPLTDPLGYTPDARTQLPHGLVGWLSDRALSSLLAGARAGDVPQLHALLAETASFTTERPGLSRRMLAVLPRDADPDPVAFRGLLDAVTATPWVAPVAPGDLRHALERGDTSSLERRSARLPEGVQKAQVSGHDVAAAQALRSDLSALGEVLESPTRVTGDLQRDTLGLVSSSWRGHPSRLAARRARVTDQVHDLVAQLHVLPTRANFLATNASLPFTVANDLDENVAGLRLKVTAPNPRLEVRQEVSDPIEVASGTRVRVEVPVRAIAAGRVSLTAQLLTPSGRELGEPVSVQVRTQPPGTWAMWVIGAVVGLVLLVGIVRAVRRPRRTVPVTSDAQEES